MRTFPTLPAAAPDLTRWSWASLQPLYRDLLERPLTQASIPAWLQDWTDLSEVVDETEARLFIATTVAVHDQAAHHRYQIFVQAIQPQVRAADHQLKQKLLASHVTPPTFAVPLRAMRAEAALFRATNLPLLAELEGLATEYRQVLGTQTMVWEGTETPITQLSAIYQHPDRAQREQAWRLAAACQLEHRDTLTTLWLRALELRRQLARNAGLPDYRAFRWHQLLRLDYTPADCQRLHHAIETVVVPLATRIYERRRQQLGVAELRPWDLEVDPLHRPPLCPFHRVEELADGVARICEHLDPQFRRYFDMLRQEGLIDLAPRAGKSTAGGGYSVPLRRTKRAFIWLNATGQHRDVQVLLHEAGHAFHALATHPLPYFQQREPGIEVRELIAIALELLAAQYLAKDQGRFYSEAEAARALVAQLERMVVLWPAIARVDAFQHWAYTTPDVAMQPEACDAMWVALTQRFMPAVSWAGVERELALGWQQNLQLHTQPFYFIEYAVAQLGALQIWRHALHDQDRAIEQYRQAMALGNTVSLPQLYERAGARLAFDTSIVREITMWLEEKLKRLQAQAQRRA